jgi:hypothetical protein
MRNDDLDYIENQYGVNITVHDEDGSTRVYAYTEDGEHIGFDFNSMNPSVDDVMQAAQAVDRFRNLSNRRPRIGKVATP